MTIINVLQDSPTTVSEKWPDAHHHIFAAFNFLCKSQTQHTAKETAPSNCTLKYMVCLDSFTFSQNTIISSAMLLIDWAPKTYFYNSLYKPYHHNALHFI